MTQLDYVNPDYAAVFADRYRRLEYIRNTPDVLDGCKEHYRTHPWDFISDWGMTFDPRNVERGLISRVPFVLWPKQIEYLQWLYASWRAGRRGLAEKSRDCGITWCSVGFGVSMWLFEPGFVVGFGSRKEELVDKAGDDKSIFEKLRFFIGALPSEFRPLHFNERLHSKNMNIINPDNGSSIVGEAGNEIGRGGRTSVYFVDEAAFVENQKKVDKALSQTTNCQVDISTFNGNGNPFYQKQQRFQNTDRHFVFDWKDDPRKDDEWYKAQLEEQDEETVAQEIDRDPNASNTDAFIPAKWVAAAMDAHIKLGFEGSGVRVTAFDPADVGDAKAVVNRYGSVIEEAEQLKKGDITQAMPWAYNKADQFRADYLVYDADGLGAPSIKLTFTRMCASRIKIVAYRGSGAIINPGAKYKKGSKTNKDMFLNFRAQSWTWARDRFQAVYKAVQLVNKGHVANFDPEKMISISTNCKHAKVLQAELSRPKRIYTDNGKIRVESKKEMKARGVESPNLGDACVQSTSVSAPKESDIIQAPLHAADHVVMDPGMSY